MKFSEKKIKLVVKILKTLYLVMAIIGLLLLILAYFFDKIEFINESLSILVLFVYFFGLKNKSSWVVPVILFFSALKIIYAFLFFPSDFYELIGNFLGFGLDLFQLYFFTRKEVRKYFGAKGLFLFSK